MDKCYIQNEASNQLINRVRILLQEVQETPYDKVTHRKYSSYPCKICIYNSTVNACFHYLSKENQKIDYLISTLKNFLI